MPSVHRGQTCAYVIESPSKALIESIYGLFLKYDHVDAEFISSNQRPDFTMTLVNPGTIHVSGTLNREKTRRSIVTCRTLADCMTDQTVPTANDRIAQMLELIREQMLDLEAQNWSVPYYGLDDILVINDTFFCFFNDDKLFTFDPDTRLMDVTRPISRDRAFYAPELKGRLHALPYTADYRASLYSLGLLAAFCALLKWDLVVDAGTAGAAGAAGAVAASSWRTYSDSELVSMLDPIKHSKLYWFVLRCCRTDAERRLCVFV